MKVTLLDKERKSLTLNNLSCNSFGIIATIESESSWRVGDLIYRPILLSDRIANFRDGTWGNEQTKCTFYPVNVEEIKVKYKE